MSRAKPPSPKVAPPRKTKRPPAALPGLLALGKSYTEIADTLGLDREAVSRWAKTPKIVAEVERIQREASEDTLRRLKGLQERATDALSDVLDSRGATVANARVRAAAEVFDRTGITKRTELELSGGLGLDVELGAKTDPELDREILEAAISIAIERQRPDIAEGLRELLAA